MSVTVMMGNVSSFAPSVGSFSRPNRIWTDTCSPHTKASVHGSVWPVQLASPRRRVWRDTQPSTLVLRCTGERVAYPWQLSWVWQCILMIKQPRHAFHSNGFRSADIDFPLGMVWWPFGRVLVRETVWQFHKRKKYKTILKFDYNPHLFYSRQYPFYVYYIMKDFWHCFIYVVFKIWIILFFIRTL